MNRYGVPLALTMSLAAAAAAGMPLTIRAASSYDMRKQVVRLAGITDTGGTEEYITRGEFAQMLVNASAYKLAGTGSSATAVYADVPAGSQYAAAIRVSSENEWMTGYLGGAFRPDNQITLQEAARGILALLGYSNEDFNGNQIGGRWAKFQELELNENISKQSSEILSRQDAVNLFYNLLRTDTKNGSAYCISLGYELTSDGEVNAMTVADNELKGPKVVKKSYSIDDFVPFSDQEATYYLNGEISNRQRVISAKNSEGFVVIYYNSSSRTIWAYSPSQPIGQEGTGMVAIRGRVTGIFYSSTNVMTPSTVVLDDEYSGVEFRLGNSEVQFGFSIYGDIKVGDEVVLICQVTSGADGASSYTVESYVEY